MSSTSLSPYFQLVWIAYIFMAPFYIFQSGYPQPADLILLTGLMPVFAFYLLKGRTRIPSAMLIGLAFVTLTFSINIIHFVFTPDRKFLLSSLYYVYNFGVFLFVTHLFASAPQQTNKLTYWALAASIVTELLVVVFLHGDTIRAQGTFNNPNQLGYWSLLSVALLIVVKRNEKINMLDSALMLMVLFTQILSLSKAGILSMLFCFGVLFFSRLLTNSQRVMLLMVTLFAGFYIFFLDDGMIRKFQDLEILEALYNRLSTIGTQGDDSLDGRGYDRIAENPHYLILGAGEGANWRYSMQAKELHSGLATLLFSYGVLGFTIFFAFLGAVFNRLPWRYAMLLVPIMMYGLTHQNIRFTYFWVFIAAAYSWRYFQDTRPVEEAPPNASLADDGDVGKTPPRQNTP